MSYFDLACKYAACLEKPSLIIVCGLMGVGKSQLAKKISIYCGAESISMDILRKKMLNIPSQQRHYNDFGKGIYDDETTIKVYQEAFSIARNRLTNGVSVVIDASFKKKTQRLSALALAQEVNANFIVISCECSDEIIEERLKKRELGQEGISDGRWEIFEKQKLTNEKIDEILPENFFVIDTSSDKNETAFRALSILTEKMMQ